MITKTIFGSIMVVLLVEASFVVPIAAESSAPQNIEQIDGFAARLGAPPGFTRVMIGFEPLFKGRIAELIEEHGGRIKDAFRLISAISAILPTEVIPLVEKLPFVRYVEEDHLIRSTQELAQPYPAEVAQEIRWNLEAIGADKVWNISTGRDIKVAVIDSGIDYNHEDLAGNIKGGVELTLLQRTTNRLAWYDVFGHGTHCAGIIGAMRNGKGIVGVAPDVSLYAVKVFTPIGYALTSDIVEAIEWCVDNDMDIVSMSLGGGPFLARIFGLKEACEAAYEHGLLLVAASGNWPSILWPLPIVSWPAAYDSIIAVGATNSTNAHAFFSCRGPQVELSAPGVGVYSTLPHISVAGIIGMAGFYYGPMDGTSMACPHVAGVAALVWAANPSLSNEEVREILSSTARNLGSDGKDTLYGHGLVDAEAAVTEALNRA